MEAVWPSELLRNEQSLRIGFAAKKRRFQRAAATENAVHGLFSRDKRIIPFVTGLELGPAAADGAKGGLPVPMWVSEVAFVVAGWVMRVLWREGSQ